MVSDFGRKCLTVLSIVTLIAVSVRADDPPKDDESNCNIKPQVLSCDKNKVKYSVVVHDGAGDKIVFNHSIERIPATKPPKPTRRLKPGMKPAERVAAFRSLMKERAAAFKEKMAMLIAKRRAKMRRDRKRLLKKE